MNIFQWLRASYVRRDLARAEREAQHAKEEAKLEAECKQQMNDIMDALIAVGIKPIRRGTYPEVGKGSFYAVSTDNSIIVVKTSHRGGMIIEKV